MCKKKNPISECLNKNGATVSLDGSWGNGKTYKWKNEIRHDIDKRDKVYISMFGLNNVSELKRAIFNEYLKKKQSFFGFVDGSVNELCGWCKVRFVLKYLFHSMYYAFLSFSKFILVPAIITLVCLYLYNEYASKIPSIYGQYTIIALLLVSCVCIFVKWWENISNFYLDKYLGINSDTVETKQLFNPNNAIICFDDFERIADNAEPKEFFGFFRTLATEQGFSILVIISKCNMGTTKYDNIKNYIEKTFDNNFIHEDKGTISKIITAHAAENETLKQTLLELFHKFSDVEEQEKLTDKDKETIKSVSENIRIWEKILNNIDIIYNRAGGYENLEKDKNNHVSLIKYISLVTIGSNYGYDFRDMEIREVHTHFEEKNAIETLIFGRYIEYDDSHRSIYDLLFKGEYDEEMFAAATTTTDNTTELERFFQGMDYMVYYKEEEVRKFLIKVQELIKKGGLFSSYAEMKKVLSKIVQLCESLSIPITDIDNNLIKEINLTVKKEDIPLGEFNGTYLLGLMYSDNTLLKRNVMYLETAIKYCVVMNRYKKALIDENYVAGLFDTSIQNIRPLYYIGLVKDKNKFIEVLAPLKNKENGNIKDYELTLIAMLDVVLISTTNYEKYINIKNTKLKLLNLVEKEIYNFSLNNKGKNEQRLVTSIKTIIADKRNILIHQPICIQ